MNEELAQAGSNVRFTSVSADTEGTPDGAAKAVQTVVQTSGAQAIIGPLTTSEVLGAKQFADENEITIFAPASSGEAAAIPDDFIFRVMYPPDTFAGLSMTSLWPEAMTMWLFYTWMTRLVTAWSTSSPKRFKTRVGAKFRP